MPAAQPLVCHVYIYFISPGFRSNTTGSELAYNEVVPSPNTKMCYTKLVIEHCVCCNVNRGADIYVSRRVICDMHDRRYPDLYKPRRHTDYRSRVLREYKLEYRVIKLCFLHAKFAHFIMPAAVAKLD